LALDAFEEKHKIDWTQARILQFGPNPTYWKCEETTHLLCSSCPIRQFTFEMSPV